MPYANHGIYTPHFFIEMNKTRPEGEFSTCTKIDYFGHVISISSDQSLCPYNELKRTDIIVVKAGVDVTASFLEEYNRTSDFPLTMFTSADDLHFIMDAIKKESQRVVKTPVDVFVEKQEPLGKSFSDILYDNIGDLYTN